MGKPAARVGDMTAHGGTITGPGIPTVLIGGMPAATLGDMHVCPMVTPGTPPIPHAGGPITLGSTGVLIGKKPAARMGDMAVCVGPPSTIVMGCPTVLIGEVGGGGGGGGAGAGAGGGGGSATSGALTSASIAGKEPEKDENSSDFIDFIFEDKGKFSVGGPRYTLSYPNNSKSYGFLGKQIKRVGVPEGNYQVDLHAIADVKWSKKEANVGEEIELKVETIGISDGEKVLLEIYVRDSNYTDHLLEVIETQIKGDKIEAKWKMQVDEKYLNICETKNNKKKYSVPFFFFKVGIGELHEQSGLLYIRDWIEIEAKDDKGNTIANKKFKAILPDGSIEEGILDNNGKARIENTTPGKVLINIELKES